MVAVFVSNLCQTRMDSAIVWPFVGGLDRPKQMQNTNDICDLVASCWRPCSPQTNAKHKWCLRSGGLPVEAFFVSNQCNTRMVSASWRPPIGSLSRLKPMQNANEICDLVASCLTPFSYQTFTKHDKCMRSGGFLLDAIFVSNQCKTRRVSAIWRPPAGRLFRLKPMRNPNAICDLVAYCWMSFSSQADAKQE